MAEVLTVPLTGFTLSQLAGSLRTANLKREQMTADQNIVRAMPWCHDCPVRIKIGQIQHGNKKLKPYPLSHTEGGEGNQRWVLTAHPLL